MKLHPRVSQAAVDLVKRFEGFRPRAAKTPDGRFTIGYGHVLSPRDSADTADISEPEAEFLLRHDLSTIAEAVEDALLAPVNDNQFAALLSFAFNIGVDNFKGSSAVRRLNEGAYLQAAAAIELWRRADFGGDTLVVDQLVRRRAVEKALFLAPPEGFMPLPSSVLRPSFDHSVIGAAVAWAAARERTAVSRIALEGPSTAADLAVPPGREGEPAPSAAIAAADALAVRLSRILPEDEHHEPEEPKPPEPLTLEAETAPPEFSAPEAESAQEPTTDAEAVAPSPDGSAHRPGLSFIDESAVAATAAAPLAFNGRAQLYTPAPRADDSGFDLPPPPVPAAPALAAPSEPPAVPHAQTAAPVDGFDGLDFAAAPSRFDTAEHAAEPPPFISDAAEPTTEPAPPPVAAPISPWRRRMAAQAQSAPAEAATTEEASSPSLFDAPAGAPSIANPRLAVLPFGDDLQAQSHDLDAGADRPVAKPLFERPMFFAILGLVGIALFAGSIFCMMNRASFTCLIIGVVGVLAMAPAAAFFLFRFLGKPVDPASAEHASLTQMASADAATPSPAAASDAEPQPANDSPFDSAWR